MVLLKKRTPRLIKINHRRMICVFEILAILELEWQV